MADSAQLSSLRAGIEAWNRGDYDGTLQFLREDVIWRTGGLLPDVDPVYEGHEGVRRFWRDFSAPWETISISLERVLDEKPGQLLVEARFRARGREGIEVDAPFFHLWRYDHQPRVTEFAVFNDEAEARREAGLERD